MTHAAQASSSAGSSGNSRSTRLTWMGAILILLLAGAALAWTGQDYGVPVTVSVDGYAEQVRTTQVDVRGLLLDLGLNLRLEDRISPAPDTRLAPHAAVAIVRARPCLIVIDGSERQIYTHALTVGAALADARVRLGIDDEVTLAGDTVALHTPLPLDGTPAGPTRFARPHAWDGHAPQPVRLGVRRAVAVTVDDGTASYTIYTTATTLGEALRREQITLYLGDRIQPSLGSRVHAGMHAILQRSRSVLVTADGRTIRTRTRADRVANALAELGIAVAGNDRVEPPMDQPVEDNTNIRITRVLNTIVIERQTIPYEFIIVPDDELELDHQEVRRQGQSGEFRRRSQVVYEDGVETSRTLLDAWVAAEPITHTTVYGRKVVSRPVPGLDSRTYWRHVLMFATAYSKSTAGVSPSLPYFGITRLGLKMTKGIVAVDPTVIALGTRLYVPGYGLGLAGDTGGAVRGRKIDLGYDDDNLESWYRWVDVYLLDPPPARSQIRWVLPNWPPQ